MKKLLWVLPLTMMLWGCQKDVGTPDRSNTDENQYGKVEDGVKKPHKVSFYSIPDPSQGFIQCMPTSFGDVKLAKFSHVGGYGTHVGDIQMDKSTLEIIDCAFGPGEGQLTTNGKGTITADNGDELYFTSITTITAPDYLMTGTVIISGGTGRFMGCYGELVTTQGQINFMEGKAQWHNEGYIIFKK
jgi:hypothetical protein